MRLSALHAGLQATFHFGPFVLENAEVDGVAYAASGSDQVLTQCAFFFRADAKNGVARLLIERVGLQFDADAVADSRRRAEASGISLRCYRRCAARQGDPGGSDLGFAVRDIDIHKTRAADDEPEERSTVAKTTDRPELCSAKARSM